MLVVAWPQVMLFVVFMGYALSGPLEKGLTLLIKPFNKRKGPSPEQTVLDTKE